MRVGGAGTMTIYQKRLKIAALYYLCKDCHRANDTPRQRKEARRMIDADPELKQYLRRLGWKFNGRDAEWPACPLDALDGHPWQTIEWYAKWLGVNPNALKKQLKQYEALEALAA